MSSARDWEYVAAGLERIEVPGGWLYRSFYVPEMPTTRDVAVSAPVYVKVF